MSQSSAVKKIYTGYYPREYQQQIHADTSRFKVCVCHRRFGKTIYALNEIIDSSLRCALRDPQYAYIAPTYSQAKRIAWQILKDYTKNIPGVQTHEQDLVLRIPRPWRGDVIKIMLLSSENPDSIRGIYLDGVVIDEFAACDPSVWNLAARPTLSDRNGWAVFIGTPNGRNHFFDIYNHALKDTSGTWRAFLFKASETGLISQSELQAAYRDMGEDKFNQEYECDFNIGASHSYFGKEMLKLRTNNRITSVPHDPALLVDVFWDLGISDYMALWFCQVYGREVRLIKYMEEAGQGLNWWAGELKKLQQTEGYKYGRIVLPHDGAARSLETGKSRQQSLGELMRLQVEVLPRMSKSDQIDAARRLLPRCYFDAEGTARGVECLENYSRKWDEKNKVFLAQPLHNWASHGADAFQTLAIGLREDYHETSSGPRQEYAEGDFSVF